MLGHFLYAIVLKVFKVKEPDQTQILTDIFLPQKLLFFCLGALQMETACTIPVRFC